MAAPRKSCKGFKILNNPCPQWIEVYISDQFFQVRFFLANDGTVTVLEKMPGAFVPAVEASSITGEKTCHECGKCNIAGTKEHMDMIGHECPSVTGYLCFGEKFRTAFKKIFSVTVIDEDWLLLNSPDYNVIDHSS